MSKKIELVRTFIEEVWHGKFDHLSGKPRPSGRGQERVSDVVAFLNYKGVCCCSIY
jgi:hypothetical protein